ncbi:hypothetical protein, partial [Photobacterium halotolerans]|uniref:hypothetical protein n=1 Tax=Photobacterium halotolerans TaxID=265726 RepID=UPI001F17B971
IRTPPYISIPEHCSGIFFTDFQKKNQAINCTEIHLYGAKNLSVRSSGLASMGMLTKSETLEFM